jgi:hypothetical protein
MILRATIRAIISLGWWHVPQRTLPSEYSAEIAETICKRLMNGESLRAICADPAMPARATLLRWLASNHEFKRCQRSLPKAARANELDYLLPRPQSLGGGGC